MGRRRAAATKVAATTTMTTRADKMKRKTGESEVTVPGEYLLAKEPILANAGRETLSLTVKNTGDRPIQVGSHTHFFEANRALEFDRKRALGFHLNIPAGTAARFEPGDSREVELVEIGGKRVIYGFHGLVQGDVRSPSVRAEALRRARLAGFKGAEEEEE
jgi:urease subunit beta